MKFTFQSIHANIAKKTPFYHCLKKFFIHSNPQYFNYSLNKVSHQAMFPPTHFCLYLKWQNSLT